MNEQGEPPVRLDYSRPTAKRRTSRIDLRTVIATALVVTPCHFVAFGLSVVLNFSCCSSRGSPLANAVANVLRFPLLYMAWVVNPDQTGGFLLAGVNSLVWGIAIGTGLSFWRRRPPKVVHSHSQKWSGRI